MTRDEVLANAGRIVLEIAIRIETDRLRELAKQQAA